MGKQVKGWTPPEEDEIVEQQEEPTSNWVPPAEDTITDPVTPVKKKESAGLGQIDFITQQQQQFQQPGLQREKPSEKNTQKSTTSGKKETGFVAAIKDMVEQYDKPLDPKDEAPSPFINAVKRGLNLAEQANIVGPFADNPTADNLKRVADLQKESENLPTSKPYQAFSQSKTFGDALSVFVRDPARIIAELTGESLASMAKYGAPRIAAGAALGAGAGVAGLAPGVAAGAAGGALVGMSDTSLGLEYSGALLESLKEAGVNITDPEQLKKAFSDDATIDAARSHALKKGIPIAIFDLISGGIAGKIVSKPAKSLIGKIGAGATEFAVQGAMGAAGETAGQVISGEKIQPGAILGEALGEIGTTPVEVGLGVVSGKTIEDVKAVVQAEKATLNPADQASVERASKNIESTINKEESTAPKIQTFDEAGMESKASNSSNPIGNWLLNNGKKGDTITLKDGSGYEITSVQDRKDGTRELLITPFDLNEDGTKDYINSGVKLISTDNTKYAGDLFETSYTDSGGNRVTEKYQYKSSENAIPESSAGRVLQRQQEGDGSQGGERGGVEPIQQGQETAEEGEDQGEAQKIDSFAGRILKGESMQSPEDIAFYNDNKTAIDQSLNERTNPPPPDQSNWPDVLKKDYSEELTDQEKKFLSERKGYSSSNVIPTRMFFKQPVDESVDKSLLDLDKVQEEIDIEQIAPSDQLSKKEQLVENPDKATNSLPVLAKKGDTYVVVDGHHRIIRQIMSGAKSIKADIIQNQQSPDAPPPATTENTPSGEGAPPASPSTGSVALDQPEEQKLSGIKKALVSQEKIDATPIERRTTEQMLNQAKEQVDSGRMNPKSIVDEIAGGNARALQPDEVGALVYYKTQLDNQVDQLNAELVKAIETEDVDAQASAQAKLNAVNQEVDNYHTMALKTAYEQSLAFRLRQMLLDNEYNLQSQVLKYKAANNGTISPEVEAKFKELDAKLKDTNRKIREMEERHAQMVAESSAADIRQDLERQRERRKAQAQARKERINSFFDSIKAKSDPNKLNSITQVVGEAVYNGSVEAMRAAVLAGNDLATVVQSGIDYIKQNHKGDFDEDLFRKQVQPGLEKILPDTDDAGTPEMRNGKLFIPAAMIKQFAADAKDVNELTENLKKVVEKTIPDVSTREVRDAVTRYGETRSLSKEELDVRLREMKRVGRMISSLEDIQNKKRPLRSGLQRDKPTDQERRLMKEIKDGMKDLPVDEAEEARAWKNALDAVKSRLRNQITDLDNQIKTGQKTPKKKGIDYDAEATALKDQRDKLKKVIEDVEGRPKMSDEQKVRAAISAVKKNIEELENRIKNRDASARQKISAPTSTELQDLRKQRDGLREAYQQMENDLGVTENKRLERQKSAIKKAIGKYEQRIKDKDFITKKKAPVMPDAEATALKLERDKIKQQFDLEQEKARLANRSMGEKVWDTAVDVWNLPKSFLASIDMSAPFRQGAILSTSNPRAGGRAFKEMFRQAFSERKANEWLLTLRESPEYAVMRAAKLYLAEPTTKLSAKEESFISNLAGKIPIVGRAVKASERAYTAYLNKLRVDVFALGTDILREQRMTPENNPDAYKAWADFINNATGRGNLGALEMSAPVLNGLFFSPRYVASRFNLLNPVTYAKMPAPVRRQALKSMALYIGFGSIVLGLAAAAGADVEIDPRSSDFGKIRVGDTRYDVWAGFQQLVRFFAQIITGQRKSTKTGEIMELDGKSFPFETRADVLLRFGRSKLSPSAGTVANLLTGENIVGEEVTPEGELYKNVVPLYLQDIGGIYEEEGPTGLLTSAIPAFFGIGVQSYGGKSGLTDEKLDPGSELQQLNKKNKYTFSKPEQSKIQDSLDHEIDDTVFDKYQNLREKEIARLFRRNKAKLQRVEDVGIYDRMMDNISKEADRHAKYMIAREKKWRETAKKFNPGNPFRLRLYKRNEENQIVAK
jgi:hypothetical protein